MTKEAATLTEIEELREASQRSLSLTIEPGGQHKNRYLTHYFILRRQNKAVTQKNISSYIYFHDEGDFVCTESHELSWYMSLTNQSNDILYQLWCTVHLSRLSAQP